MGPVLDALGAAAVIDRFELGERVGAGGMGTVYRATDRMTGATVAVKLLREVRPADVERFRKEGALHAQLSHPAIVRYVDHGVTSSGQPYLATEWIDGPTLHSWLAAGPISVDDALTLLRRVAAALGAAHARGIVHRDVKPSNVICPGGRLAEAKLLDFGIARRADDVHGLTQTGVIVGTPGYLSPEQARADRNIDPRADVFGLGCLAYECVSGKRPFAGEHVMAIRLRVLLSVPPPLAEVAPSVPRWLADLIHAMLAKAPDGRPADGAAVLTALGGAAIPAAAPSPTAWPELAGSFVLLGSPDEVVADVDAARAGVDELATAHGGAGMVMADGGFLIVFGAGDDAAHRAARCALAIRSQTADVAMRIARLPSEGIERAIEEHIAALIASGLRSVFDPGASGQAITVDAMIAPPLADEFVIESAGAATLVVGARAPEESS